MEFIVNTTTRIVARDAEDARNKFHDLVWRHYGVHCTSELDARLNLNVVSARPDNPVREAWRNICQEGMTDA